MKFMELKKSLQEENCTNIFLFEGEDEYFKQLGENLLKDKYLTEPCLNFTSFSGDTLKGNELKNFVNACESFPFMSDKRVIKVVDFYPTEKDFETYLKPLFENFPSTTILMIFNTLSTKGKSTKLKEKKGVTFVDCSHADEQTILKWIFITFKKAGVVIDDDASDMLMRYCLFDMSKIYNETQKLISFGLENGSVSPKDVDDLVYKDSEYKIYEMTNAISKKRYEKFLEILNDLKQKGYDDISLLNSITSYFKTLFEVGELSRVNSHAQVCSILSMKDYALTKNKEQCETFQKGGLENFYFYGVELLSNIKQGRLSADSGLKLMISRIFADR